MTNENKSFNNGRINTVQLDNDLEVGPGQLKVAVDVYDGSNFPTSAGHIMALAGQAWLSFENEGCKALSDVKGWLKGQMSQWSSIKRKAVMTRDQKLLQVEGQFMEGVKGIICARLDEEEAEIQQEMQEEEEAVEQNVPPAPVLPVTLPRTDEIIPEPAPIVNADPRSKAQQEVDTLQYHFENEQIRYLGHIGGEMVKRGYDTVKKIATTFGIVYAAAEILSALKFFRAGGSRLEAYGASSLFIMIATGIADVSGYHCKLLMGWWNAKRARKSQYPRGVDQDNNPVPSVPLDASLILLGPGLFVVLLAVAVGVLSWRLNKAATDPLLRGTEFQAWLVSGGLLANWLAVFVASPYFTEEQQDKFFLAKKKFDDKVPEIAAEQNRNQQEQVHVTGTAEQSAVAAYEAYRATAIIAETTPEAEVARDAAAQASNNASAAADVATAAPDLTQAKIACKNAQRAQADAENALASAQRAQAAAQRALEAKSLPAEEVRETEESEENEDPIKQLKDIYRQQVDTIEHEAQGPVTLFLGAAQEYHQLTAQYAAAYVQVLIPGIEFNLGELINKLDIRCRKDGTAFNKLTVRKDHANKLVPLRQRACPQRLVETTFTTELEEFDPTIEPSEKILTQFDELVEKISHDERKRRRLERLNRAQSQILTVEEDEEKTSAQQS